MKKNLPNHKYPLPGLSQACKETNFNMHTIENSKSEINLCLSYYLMRNSFIYATFYLIELIGLSAIFLENLTEKKFMYNDK